MVSRALLLLLLYPRAAVRAGGDADDAMFTKQNCDKYNDDSVFTADVCTTFDDAICFAGTSIANIPVYSLLFSSARCSSQSSSASAD